MRPIKFVICSRNRPKVVERCINSVGYALRKAFPSMVAQCYIFDDSTNESLSKQMHQLIIDSKQTNLNLQVISQAKQENILKYLDDAEPLCSEFIRFYCKRLGCGPWDAAGVRNFAFIYTYSFSNENDLIIFLDDDIVFEDIKYHRRYIPVDGAEVIKQLYNLTPPNQQVASGAGYWGRFDVSIVRHIRYVHELLISKFSLAVMDEILKILKEIALFPDILPIRLITPSEDSNVNEPLGPGGISGAVLATTPASLLSHGLISFYNEDWIWQILLGQSLNDIRSVSINVVHAPPPQNATSIEFMLYQEIGEIVYQALFRTMKYAFSDQNRIIYCLDHISIDYFIDSKQYGEKMIRICICKIHEVEALLSNAEFSNTINSMIVEDARRGMRKTLYYLEEVLQALVLTDSVDLANKVIGYLQTIPTWRESMRLIKSVLSQYISTDSD